MHSVPPSSWESTSYLLVASGCVYTSLHDRRGMRGEIAYFTLEVHHRARHGERGFLLAVFECECSRAWVLASKLSRACPSTLAFRFRVRCTIHVQCIYMYMYMYMYIYMYIYMYYIIHLLVHNNYTGCTFYTCIICYIIIQTYQPFIMDLLDVRMPQNCLIFHYFKSQSCYSE